MALRFSLRYDRLEEGGTDMRQFTALCAILAMAVSAARSEDRPMPGLKNVWLVSYNLVSAIKDPCAINQEAWNTAIDFVANQSSKLKLIKEKEHYERGKELADKAGEAGRKWASVITGSAARSEAEMAGKSWDEEIEKSKKYSAAPRLLLVAEAFEHNGSCVGDLSATVSASLKPSEIIATGKLIYHPHEEIWSWSKLLAGPPNTFSRFVIQSSEEMMKSFVNDWAVTQREYAD
jgi:hypothetical protein